LNTDLGTAGIGDRDVSIPVTAILPPGFTKTQVSSQNATDVWTVNKQSTPASFNFPNTCSTSSTEPTSEGVSTTINWNLTTTPTGDITVTANLNVMNNAHRPIDVSVSDQLYTGTDPTTGTAVQAPQVTAIPGLGAGASDSFTDTWTVASGTATSFSDLATASFFDPVENDQLLGTVPAQASSTVTTAAPTSGATAVVTDAMTLSGSTDFAYSVDSISPSEGSVAPYVLGTETTDPVTWTSPTLTGSGSVTIDQTVYVVSPNTDSATLSDTATITPDGQTASQATSSSTVTGNAAVSIEIQKTTTLALNHDNTFSFTATGTDSSGGSTSITIPAGSIGPVDGTITGLNPGIAYTISEPGVAPFPPQSKDVTVNLPNCSASVPWVNTATPALAQVQKITAPTGSTQWTYTLTGLEADGTTPVSDLADGSSEPFTITANTGYQQFLSNLDVDGATYTITETPVSNWDLTSLSGDFNSDASRVTTSVSSRTCSFTLDLSTDEGKTFECSYTNTERGALKVTKDVNWNGITPVPSQTFQICITGPSYATTSVTGSCQTIGDLGGDLTWSSLIPGSYTVTETDPGSDWTVTNNGAVVTVNPGDTGTVSSDTITNAAKLGSLVVTKVVNWTGPVNTAQTFQICITGPSYASTSVSGSCQTIGYLGGDLTWSNLIPGSYTVTETDPGMAWTVMITGSPATVPANGGSGSATVTNNENPADVTVVKTQNGATPTLGYSFSLTSGANTTSLNETLTTNSTNGGTLDFGELPPGNYTLCELAVPAGTHSTLQDAPYNGTLNTTTGNVCYSFSLTAGVNITFNIDNTFPRGNALTIGYWKHWNSYTLYGNKGAAECRPNKTGNTLMDCWLPQPLGNYQVTTALQGWQVLSQPAGKYAENQLAAQLLAAELNVAAGAGTCTAETNAITHANALLAGIGYNGPPSSKVSSKSPGYADFVSTASTLNAYNNNQLC
jgi:hypothetical protein